MSRIIAPGWAAALVAVLIAPDLTAQEPRPAEAIDFEIGHRQCPGSRAAAAAGPASSATSTKSRGGPRRSTGLFTLHKIGDHLYAEIRPDQFNQPLLVPITIARGLASAGIPIGDDETVLDLPARRRPRPARTAEHPLHGAGRLAARQVGQAELHRLDPDGAADHCHEPDARLRRDRLFRHLHDRFRPAQPGHARSQPQQLAQGQGISRTTWSSRSKPHLQAAAAGTGSWRRATVWPTTAASRW